jgi:peptidoglycan DL-endopeptidase CwlO
MRKADLILILVGSVLLGPMKVDADQALWPNLYHSINRLTAQFRESTSADTDSTPAHRRSKKKGHPSPSPKKSDDASKESPIPKPSAEETDKKKGSESPEGNNQTGQEEVEQKPIAPVASLRPADLREFDNLPSNVQELIRSALALTERNLAYTYGSADPNSGGMDCSGFIYYVLTNAGYKDAPRQSSDQYLWVRKHSDFHAVLSRNSDTFELKQLRPGDLMFWSGTYQVTRDVPITHVMIYLGTEKKNNKPVMVGASDGRSYNGERRFGVSVFDFKLPNGTPNKNDPDITPRFEGYASIPGLQDTRPASDNSSSPSPSPVSPRLKLAEKDKPLSRGD